MSRLHALFGAFVTRPFRKLGQKKTAAKAAAFSCAVAV